MNFALAGVGSTLPAASVARTLNTCLPGSRCLYFFGDVQLRHFFLSSLQRNVDRFSEERNLNLARSTLVLCRGRWVIRVCGGVVSTPASMAIPIGARASVM